MHIDNYVAQHFHNALIATLIWSTVERFRCLMAKCVIALGSGVERLPKPGIEIQIRAYKSELTYQSWGVLKRWQRQKSMAWGCINTRVAGS